MTFCLILIHRTDTVAFRVLLESSGWPTFEQLKVGFYYLSDTSNT